MTRPSSPSAASEADMTDAEEAAEYPQWTLAAQAVENGECGAQLEIEDRELRRSLIRNVAAMMQSALSAASEEAERKAREECAKAVCHRCAEKLGDAEGRE